MPQKINLVKLFSALACYSQCVLYKHFDSNRLWMDSDFMESLN